VNFDEDVEKIGEDIKAEWWEKNKQRFIDTPNLSINDSDAF